MTDYNKITKNIVDNSMKSKHLVDKSAISEFRKNSNISNKS